MIHFVDLHIGETSSLLSVLSGDLCEVSRLKEGQAWPSLSLLAANI